MTASTVADRTQAEHKHSGVLGRFDRWLLSPAPAERLAALRILCGSFALIHILVMVGEFRRATRLPAEQFEPVGIVGLLDAPVSSPVVWLFFAFAVVSGVAFVGGIAFRLSGPAFAVATLGWATYHSSWGQMLHYEHLFTLFVIVIGLSPAADGWSLNSRARSAGVDVRYGWPIRLLALTTAVTYVIAGVAKLRIGGPEWVNTTTLGNHIAYSSTRLELLGAARPPLASLVVGRPWLIAPMAWVALLTELLAPVALLGGRWRRWWVVAAIVMHAGTAATMLVWFPFHGLGFAMLPLFKVEHLVGPVLQKLKLTSREASR